MLLPILKAYERLKTVANSANGKIFIRGAGQNGRILFNELKVLGITPVAFIDADNTIESCLNIPVLSPDEVYHFFPGESFIAVSIRDFSAYAQIREEMEYYGLTEINDFAHFSFDTRNYSLGFDRSDFLQQQIDVNRIESYHCTVKQMCAEYNLDESDTQRVDKLLNDNKLVLTTVMIDVTSHCTLNCTYCLQGQPYLRQKRHIPVNTILSSFSKILSIVDYIIVVTLEGGEVFLYPELDKLLDYLSTVDTSKIGKIQIQSNGTILPSDKLFHKIQNLKNVRLVDSGYYMFSKMSLEIEKKCYYYNIPYFNKAENDSNIDWLDLGSPLHSRNYDNLQLRDNYARCGSKLCHTLFGNKFYICSRLSRLHDDNIIPAVKSDYIDVEETPLSSLREKLYDYIYSTQCLHGCNYCDGISETSRGVPRARQNKLIES
jgi:hypothetical protein